MVADSIELQYKIELDTHGMSDCRVGQLSIRERLELLSEYRQAWRTGQGKRTVVTHQPHADAHWGFQVMDGVALSLNEAKHIVHWLPSRTDDGRRISFDNVPVMSKSDCWAFDTSQDLFIYVNTVVNNGENVLSITIHTLSGNIAHPNAARPYMAYPGGNDRRPDQIDTLENIATFSSKERMDVLLLDWKTGQVLAVRHIDLTRSLWLLLTKFVEARTRRILDRYCKIFACLQQLSPFNFDRIYIARVVGHWSYVLVDLTQGIYDDFSVRIRLPRDIRS